MYGLVLEGGGAKGSYHVGVYKALSELNIEIKGVTGSSIGALNGAMIAQGDYDKCYELWNQITYSMVANVDDEEIDKIINRKIAKEDLSRLRERLRELISNRGFDITPLKSLLTQHIDEDRIRKSGIDFGMTTINLSELKPLQIFLEDIPLGELTHYLMASAYLPVFKFEKIGGSLYLDGGFFDNLPFRMLIDRGYEDLILVRTHAVGLTRRLDLGDTNSVVISPSGNIGKSYEYSAKKARKNTKMGYYDGLRPFKGLKGNKYYILPKEDEDYYLRYLINVEEDKISKIRDVLKAPEGSHRRVLLEYIIPKVCTMLSIDRECGYEEILIYLLEKKAEKLNIDRFKIYTFEELLSEVKNKQIPKKQEERVIDKLIEKVEILPILNREEVILYISDILFSKEN